jgi:hypothetical protein
VRRSSRRAPPSALANLCRPLVQAVWDRAAAASNAVSEALIEASDGPLYTKERHDGTAWTPALESVPMRALDKFLAGCEPQTSTEEPFPAVRIVAEADGYLGRVPGGGALLKHLIAYIVQRTGYRKSTVRGVVLQNFQSNGELVWK